MGDREQRGTLQALLSHGAMDDGQTQKIDPDMKELLKIARKYECMLPLLKLVLLNPADGLFQKVDGKDVYIQNTEVPNCELGFFIEDSAFTQCQNRVNEYAICIPNYAQWVTFTPDLIKIKPTKEQLKILKKHCQVPDRVF